MHQVRQSVAMLGDRPQQHKLGLLQRHQWQRWLAAFLAAMLLWCGLPQAIASARAEVPTTGSIQPYLDAVADRVASFTLDNGMRFIVLERHQAPVVSFMTYVNVGAANEAEGKTGAAHFLEHLAFKGTRRIGTQDYRAERPLLNRLDRLSERIEAAKAAGQDQEAARLETAFEATNAKAADYIKQNEFATIVEQAGGVGLNATTSADATRYFYSFPANRLELWMSLESERFLEPVFREFYEEKDVILEERRMRTDNSPIGRMTEAFLEKAFPGHPYGRPIIGYEAEIRNLTRKDIQTFFETYYTPDHMVAAVVGDVDADRVKELAEAYFGRFTAKAKAPDVEAIAPTQTEPQEVTLRLPSEPWYLAGYQRPSINDDDSVIYGMIASLLVSGRTSRLYQSLVEQQQLALNVDIQDGFPGDRYPTLMLIYALSAPGHTIDQIAAAMNAELERLQTEPVSPEELDRVKTQARAGLLRTLSSNNGMASLLAEYEAKTGSWRNLFDELTKIEAVTADDVQRVAQSFFQPEKLTIGRLLSAGAGDAETDGVEVGN